MINIQDYYPYQYGSLTVRVSRQPEADTAAAVGNSQTSPYTLKAPASSYVSSAPTSSDLAPLDYTKILGKLGTEQSIDAAVGRVHYSDSANTSVMDGESETAQYPPALRDEIGASDAKSAREVFEESECQTCKNRKYQDGSDDPGVSFKAPTHIDPDTAASQVRGHEMEHVTREQAEARNEDRKVVSQTVSYHTEICPECGRVYISGGETRTVTAADNTGTEPENESQIGNSL